MHANASNFTFPGSVHAGFAKLANYFWDSGLRDVLAAQTGLEQVAIAGHSLGAGVSTLVSYMIKVRAAGVGRGRGSSSLAGALAQDPHPPWKPECHPHR